MHPTRLDARPPRWFGLVLIADGIVLGLVAAGVVCLFVR